MNFDTYRPFISKFFSPFVGLAITALNKRYGLVFDGDVVGMAVASLTDLVVFAISTGVTHIVIQKRVNPGNAASAHLAGVEKAETMAIKAKADMYDAARGNQ